MLMQRSNSFVALLVLTITVLTGCVHLPGTGVAENQLTPAQRDLRQRNAVFSKTIWQGVVLGAATGALIRLVTGGDSEDAIKAAVIGGVLGAVAGGYIASKQRQYADREDQLNSMIADVQQKNREAAVLIVSMEEVIAEDRRRIANLRQQQQRGEASEAQLKQALKVVREDRKQIADATESAQEQLGVFEESSAYYRDNNPDIDTRGLDREIEVFQARINTMNDIVADLSADELG